MTVDEALPPGSRFNFSRKSFINASFGRDVELGDGLRGDEMEVGVATSTRPANKVDANDTSVVDTMEDAESAGDGVRGSVSNCARRR